jgi:hypothetical protein
MAGTAFIAFAFWLAHKTTQPPSAGQLVVQQRPHMPVPMDINQPSPVIVGLGKLVGNLGVNQGVIYRDSFGHQIMVERVATNTQSDGAKVFIGRTAQGQTFAYRQMDDGSIEMVK